MLIICIVVALLVSALVCLVVLGHHIERQRQSKAELERILKPSNFTAREINEGFAKVRREREARSAAYLTPSRGRRYDDTEPANPLHITAPYPTHSRSDDCAAIGVDMAAAADRTVVHHCSAPSSYNHGSSDSYSCSSDSGYSSSSCDSSSSSSCCD